MLYVCGCMCMRPNFCCKTNLIADGLLFFFPSSTHTPTLSSSIFALRMPMVDFPRPGRLWFCAQLLLSRHSSRIELKGREPLVQISHVSNFDHQRVITTYITDDGVGIGFHQLLIGPFRFGFCTRTTSGVINPFLIIQCTDRMMIPEYSLGTSFSTRRRLKAWNLAVHWHRAMTGKR